MFKSARHGITLALGLGLVLTLSSCGLTEKLPFGRKDDGAQPVAVTPDGKPDKAAAKKYVEAGNALTKQAKWQDAIEQYELAVQADSHHSIAHSQMGWAYAELKDWNQAKMHLLQAIDIDSKNASAWANLAWVYAEQKNWHESQQAAKKAIDLDPKNGYAHATLAWAYQETKQTDLAISEYQQSIKLIPDLANSHFALGMALCNKGLGPRAKEHHQHLVRLGSPMASELDARISKGCYPPK